jgi:hypothetical protein
MMDLSTVREFQNLPGKQAGARRQTRGVLAATLLLCACLWCQVTGCTHQWPGASPRERIASGQVAVVFSLVAPHAGQVCVAGSFNQWSAQNHCLTRRGESWLLRIALPPGRYSYVFVLDGGDWQPDPGAVLCEDNGFGSRNSVLVVE